MIALSLLLLLAGPAAAGEEEARSGESAAGDAAGDAAVATHLAQARLFAKKKWYEDARAELQAALALPAGAESYEVHRLAHDVAWALLDVESARELAAGAARTAPDGDRRAEAEALVASYDSQFGVLVVQGPYDSLASRLQLELQSVLFDAELKRFANQLALQLREKHPLPLRVGLPAGTWLVNGEEVQVLAGEETELVLPMRALGARGLAALQVFRLEVSAGLGAKLGEDTRALVPSPQLQVAATQPLGPVLLGLFLDQGVTRFRGETKSLEDPQVTWGGGVRLGAELNTRAPLAVRPSLVLRTYTQPGLPLDCVAAGEAWSCGGDVDDPELRVYAVGTALAPGAELSVDYREAGRTTALGTGVKIVVDQALGRFPEEAQATLPAEGGQTITWSPGEARWSATSIRVLANVSFAF